MRRSPGLTRSSAGVRLIVAVAAALAMLVVVVPGALAASRHPGHTRVHHKHVARIRKFGELDCNGYSRRQHPVKGSLLCTDIRGVRGHTTDWTWRGRFFDNGHYIGHDEPDMTFLSSAPSSGDNVSWVETLPTDPAGPPTVAHPGSDNTHWFELSPAPWFSMAQCDPKSYPQTGCTPQSDSNAPQCLGVHCPEHAFPGGGSAFMELQFYPPGFAPIWTDGISCDNTHWCAAMTIDSLECTLGFVHCNPNCIEPVNFALISSDGSPAGPPSPQLANQSTFTPNSKTLLMNPGDRIAVHMWDAPVPGEPGQKAFKAVVVDLTTGQTGFMQASAKNGFQDSSIEDCSGTPFNFQPEYNTASRPNITPWAALQTDISTQYEIGHFEACTSITDTGEFHYNPRTLPDTYWKHCQGPYETTTSPDGPDNPELSDAPCFPVGYTHGPAHTPPDTVTGCFEAFTQNGDLDFNGSSYWPDWPVGLAPTQTFPGSFAQGLPTTDGRQYAQYFIQTDAALSESTCPGAGPGCAVPPPNAPGAFYPYWTRVGSSAATCTIEFGNVSTGQTFGKDAQYGTDQFDVFGYPEFIGPIRNNSSCT